MELELQQAHAELNQIFQTASVGMRLVDSNFNVLKINKTFESLTGVEEAHAIGKKCHEIFSGPTCFTEQCSILRILNGKEAVESHVDKERPDGKRVSCIINATPFLGPEGDIIGVVESFRDITELINAQKAVASERDMLERILSHLHEGVSIINGEHTVEYQNEIFGDYFGDCAGKTCHSVIYGEQRPCEPCLMQAAVATGRIQEAGVPRRQKLRKSLHAGDGHRQSAEGGGAVAGCDRKAGRRGRHDARPTAGRIGRAGGRRGP